MNPSLPGQRFPLKPTGLNGHLGRWIGQPHIRKLHLRVLFSKFCFNVLMRSACWVNSIIFGFTIQHHFRLHNTSQHAFQNAKILWIVLVSASHDIPADSRKRQNIVNSINFGFTRHLKHDSNHYRSWNGRAAMHKQANRQWAYCFWTWSRSSTKSQKWQGYKLPSAVKPMSTIPINFIFSFSLLPKTLAYGKQHHFRIHHTFQHASQHAHTL